MSTTNLTAQVLMKLLSDSRKQMLDSGIVKAHEMGCCVYPDVNNPGDTLCGDNWSQAMCDYAAGTFYPGELCKDHE